MNSATARLTALPTPSLPRARDAAPVSQSIHLEIVRDEQDFLALAGVWDELLSSSAIRTPFLTWDWVNLWWNEHRDEFRPAIGVVRDVSGTALAIAPLTIGRPARGPRRHLRHLTFLGGVGDIASEGLDFIVPRGMETLLTPVLCQVFARLRSQWDTVTLPMIHEESPNLSLVLAALEGLGSGARIVGRHPSHFITLPESWEGIEMSHGQNWRSNHRRKWKKMLALHGGRALRGGFELGSHEALDALVALHSRRWSDGESYFLSDRARSFHRELMRCWLPQNRMSISVLELDGTPGAATYCFNHDGRAWFYQAGWNAEYSGISIGKLAVAWAVQCAIQLGLRDFDFLPGNQPYKQEWSNGVRHVVDVEAFNPLSPRAVFFRFLRFCKRRTTRAISAPSGATPPPTHN